MSWLVSADGSVAVDTLIGWVVRAKGADSVSIETGIGTPAIVRGATLTETIDAIDKARAGTRTTIGIADWNPPADSAEALAAAALQARQDTLRFQFEAAELAQTVVLRNAEIDDFVVELATTSRELADARAEVERLTAELANREAAPGQPVAVDARTG